MSWGRAIDRRRFLQASLRTGVVLGGASAFAPRAKVSTLMAMPAAQGLFHKAIAQSGFALRMVEPDAATANAERLLAELGLAPDRVGELQDVPTERLLGAFQAIRSGPGRGFAPVVDGRALPRHPWTPDAPPGSADVPLMLGCTRDETTILLGMLGPDPDAMFQLEEGDMRRRLAERLETDEATTASIVETYRAALSPAPPAPPASPSDVYFRATSDHMMRVPSILQAERKAVQPGAPAWLYLFTWESPFMSGRMKAHHGAELPFVFDTIEANADRIGGAGPDRRALADQMLAAWSRFAHTGDPNHPGLPAWQPYSLTERDTMLFDMPSQLASDPYGSTREAMTLIVAVR